MVNGEEGCGLGPVVTSQHSSSARDAGAGWPEPHLQSVENLDLSLMPSIIAKSMGLLQMLVSKVFVLLFLLL